MPDSKPSAENTVGKGKKPTPEEVAREGETPQDLPTALVWCAFDMGRFGGVTFVYDGKTRHLGMTFSGGGHEIIEDAPERAMSILRVFCSTSPGDGFEVLFNPAMSVALRLVFQKFVNQLVTMCQCLEASDYGENQDVRGG